MSQPQLSITLDHLLLKIFFSHFPTPTAGLITSLADALGKTNDEVQLWFNNNRASDKALQITTATLTMAIDHYSAASKEYKHAAELSIIPHHYMKDVASSMLPQLAENKKSWWEVLCVIQRLYQVQM